MADDDLFKSLFPTRTGTPVGHSDERKMIEAVGGPDTIRTRIQTNLDGSTTRLKTRAGHPDFTTEGGDEVTYGNWYHGSWDTSAGWKTREGAPHSARVTGSTIANQSAAWSSGQPAHCAMLMNFEMPRKLWNTDEKRAPDPPTWKKNILHGIDKKFSILHTEGFSRRGWPYKCADKTVWFLQVSDSPDDLTVKGAAIISTTFPTPATTVGTLPNPEYYDIDYYGVAWSYAVVTFSPVDGSKAAIHYYKLDRDANNTTDSTFYDVLVAITEVTVTGGSATTPPTVTGSVTCPLQSTQNFINGRNVYGPLYGIHAGSLESVLSAGPHLNYFSIQYDKRGNRCAMVQYLTTAHGSSFSPAAGDWYLGQFILTHTEQHTAVSPPSGFSPGDLWEVWIDTQPTLLIQCRKTTPTGEEVIELYRRTWAMTWYAFVRAVPWGSGYPQPGSYNHLEQTLSGPDGVGYAVNTNIPASDVPIAGSVSQELIVDRVKKVPRMFAADDMSAEVYTAEHPFNWLDFSTHTTKMMNDAVLGVFDPVAHTLEVWATAEYVGDHTSSPITLDTHDQVIVDPSNGHFSPTTTLYF
ncbi:MAG TPA: hypothetical protein PKD65_05335 [Nitrospira sp.]|nr:hypothetical protein [Nitrospira sp.]HNG03648.1 hypothetical protein [Nitrospira sp.]